jgi:hypothetical protein
MCDRDVRVRRAAAQSMSRLLGQDVTSLVTLDEAQRRREVRRLAQLPVKVVPPLTARAKVAAALQQVPAAGAKVGAPARSSASHVAAPASTAGAPLAREAGPAAARAETTAAAPVAKATPVVVTAAVAMAAPVTTAAVPALPASVAAVAAPAREVAPAPFGVKSAMQTLATEPARARVAVLEVEAAPAVATPALTAAVLRELRAAMRGRPLNELADGVGASMDETMRACGALMAEGQVVRRGHKYFVA